MLFFPGIQIEVTTFLQSIRVISTHEVFTEELEHFFSIADAGLQRTYTYLFCNLREMSAGFREGIGISVLKVSVCKECKG